MTKYLGIDYGAKRIGLAISDDEGKIAFPYGIIENKGNIVSEIMDVCNKEGVQKIVLGESVNYQREKNPIMEEIEKLKKELEKEKPVYYEQEFLTSHQAHKSRNLEIQKSKKPVDSSAAAIILQSYLDSSR